MIRFDLFDSHGIAHADIVYDTNCLPQSTVTAGMIAFSPCIVW